MNFSRSHFRNYIFPLFMMNWFKHKNFRSTFDEDLYLVLLSSFIVSIQVLNSRRSHFMFLGARARFQASLGKKLCFSVLVLNRIKVKDSRFIIGEQFHLLLLVSFLFIEAWYECFFRFSLSIINEGEIFDVKSAKRFDFKMFVQVEMTFPNLRLAIACL